MTDPVDNHQDDPLFDRDLSGLVELDVRHMLRQAGEPLATILTTLDAMDADGVLHLRTTFLPTPLLTKLARGGWNHSSAQFAEDDWSSWFWRGDRRPAAAVPNEAPAPEAVEDLRGLSPPEPLLRILRRIETELLPFEVLLPFRPEPLERILDDSDWSVTVVQERPDGVIVRVAPR
ncbi:MAG: DUF2249 domain-containing protein [Gemmatimonadota bacterium]